MGAWGLIPRKPLEQAGKRGRGKMVSDGLDGRMAKTVARSRDLSRWQRDYSSNRLCKLHRQEWKLELRFTSCKLDGGNNTLIVV